MAGPLENSPNFLVAQVPFRRHSDFFIHCAAGAGAGKTNVIG